MKKAIPKDLRDFLLSVGNIEKNKAKHLAKITKTISDGGYGPQVFAAMIRRLKLDIDGLYVDAALKELYLRQHGKSEHYSKWLKDLTTKAVAFDKAIVKSNKTPNLN